MKTYQFLLSHGLATGSTLAMFLSLASLPVAVQQPLKAGYDRAFTAATESPEVYNSDPSKEVRRIVDEICKATGVTQNIDLRADEVNKVKNALATTISGRRTILYSTVFLKKIGENARTRWAVYAVLAHEVGHHARGHDFSEPDLVRRKRMELQADSFSGAALRLLGASCNEAKAGIEMFALDIEQKYHPPVKARLEAVAKGCKNHKPIDTDGDGVPDLIDKCPQEKGDSLCEGCRFRGNPETGLSIGSMILVKGGAFDMGCKTGRDENCKDNEKPVRSVTVGDFYIGKYEVTQADWAKVMCGDPSYFKGCDNCPVENVSWDDVQVFLKKLNDLLPGKNYRLPTEAEWEYAARGGDRTENYRYAGGNTLTGTGWYAGNSGGKTHPVGSLKPNELGIFDMSGNVWEWCAGDEAEPAIAGKTLPIIRSVRGGAWSGDTSYCRVAARHGFGFDHRDKVAGFRLVR